MTTSHDNMDLSALEEDMALVRELSGLDDLNHFDDLDAPSGSDGSQSQAPPSLDRLREQIDQAIAEDSGVVAFLRGRPTFQRVGCVLLLTGMTAVAAAMMGSTEHLNGPGRARFIAVIVLVAAVTMLACWRLLRPIHLPPANRWVGDGLLAVGVVLPFLMALTLGHTDGPPGGSGMQFWKECTHCLMMGTMLGLPVLGLALLLRRAKVDGASIGALAGVAAGLTGYLTLHIGCTISDPAHVIGGHASVLLLLGSAAALWRWRERARANR